MRIFETNDDWCQRINFVDRNNLLVGFNNSQNCCERFGYSLSSQDTINLVPFHDEATDEYNDDYGLKIPDEVGPSDEELEPFVFDRSFHEVRQLDPGYNCANVAVFRLLNDRGRELFLYLYNQHNGYYSHGFDFQDEIGLTIFEGAL